MNRSEHVRLLAILRDKYAETKKCTSRVKDFKARSLISVLLSLENVALIAFGVLAVYVRKLGTARRQQRRWRHRARFGERPKDTWCTMLLDYKFGPVEDFGYHTRPSAPIRTRSDTTHSHPNKGPELAAERIDSLEKRNAALQSTIKSVLARLDALEHTKPCAGAAD